MRARQEIQEISRTLETAADVVFFSALTLAVLSRVVFPSPGRSNVVQTVRRFGKCTSNTRRAAVANPACPRLLLAARLLSLTAFEPIALIQKEQKRFVLSEVLQVNDELCKEVKLCERVFRVTDAFGVTADSEQSSC